MANYSTLKAAVADVVKTNGTQAITGANLQAVLLSIINSVGGGGYIFKGVATPSTDAGTPDENVFYLGGAGTYANFGTSITVPVGSIGVFKYNGSWTKEQVKMFEGIDDVPTANSNNLVKSGGVEEKIIKNYGDLLKATSISVYPVGILVKSNLEVISANTTWDSYVVYLPSGVECITFNFPAGSIYIAAKFQNLPTTGDFGSAVTINRSDALISVGENTGGCWVAITYTIATQTEANPVVILNSFNNSAFSSKIGLNIVLNPYFIEDYYISCTESITKMNIPKVTSLSGWRYLVLKVKTGDVFIFNSVVAGTSGGKVWATYDMNGNRLDYCATESYTGTLTIVTDGFLYMNIAPNNTTGTITANRLSVYQDFAQELNIGILAVLDNLKNTMDDFEELNIFVTKSKNLYDGSFTDNSIISNGGDLTNVPSWTYNQVSSIIPVEPNRYYYISGDMIIAGKNIRCLDSNGQKLKVLAPQTGTSISSYEMPKADASGASSTMNGMFKTPANAVSVQFNVGAYNTSSVGLVMLEYVGETYDPNFVPSPYEPYSEEKVINFDLLPDKVKDAVPAIDRDFRIKLLLIGSSHGMNTIAQLPWMAYKAGFDVEIGNVYIGSLSLQRLVGIIRRNETIDFKVFKNGAWTTIPNMKFNDVISYANWGFISLQRSATDDELWLTTQKEADTEQNVMTDINYQVSGASPVYMSHTEALQIIINTITGITSAHPSIIFNTGFADPSEGTGTSQTTAILQTANIMKNEFGIEYVPVATAIRNARNTYLKNIGAYSGHYLCYDSQHLDYGIGCYVASATLLEFILKKWGNDIETLVNYGTQAELQSFISIATPTNYTEPTTETMNVAKACAKAACNMVDETSDAIANRFKWQITYNLASGVSSSENKGYSANEDIYTTTLSGTINTVTVTMGGVDVTSTVYNSSTHTISIASVTGDVTITAN